MTTTIEIKEDGNERHGFKVKDEFTLVSTFFDNPSSRHGIILFPGITEHRSSLDGLSKQLAKEFKVWAFDLNSQGDSTGNWDLLQMQYVVNFS